MIKCFYKPVRLKKRTFTHCDIFRIFVNHLDSVEQAKVIDVFGSFGAVSGADRTYEYLSAFASGVDNPVISGAFAAPVAGVLGFILALLIKFFGKRFIRAIFKKLLDVIIEPVLKRFVRDTFRKHAEESSAGCRVSVSVVESYFGG